MSRAFSSFFRWTTITFLGDSLRRTKEDDILRESSFKRYGKTIRQKKKRYGKTKHRTFPFPKSEEPGLMNQSSHQMSQSFSFSLLVSWKSYFSYQTQFIIRYCLLSVSHRCNYKVLLNLHIEVILHVINGLIDLLLFSWILTNRGSSLYVYS